MGWGKLVRNGMERCGVSLYVIYEEILRFYAIQFSDDQKLRLMTVSEKDWGGNVLVIM